MGDQETATSKHRSNKDDKREHKRHKEHKRHRHDRDEDGGKRKKRKDKSGSKVVDDDPEEDMWVEKNIDMDGEKVRIH
jgi:hypothetical protein